MIPLMFRLFILYVVFASSLSACNLSSTAEPAVSADSGSTHQNTIEATSTPTVSDISDIPTATQASIPPTPDRCTSDENRSTRSIHADVKVDYETKVVDVSQRIEFLNREETPLNQLVLDVQPNQWPDSFSLAELTIDEQPSPYQLVLNRLQINLAEALQSGCWLKIGIRFRLQPAAIRDGLRSYRGFFGHGQRQFNLGHFLPTVAARMAGDWRIHEPIGIGEQVVYEVADWKVDLTVENAAQSLQLAAPGNVSSLGGGKWTISLSESRDFALSLSEEFIVLEQSLSDGVTLAVFSFADAQINDRGLLLDGAAHVVQEAVKALELFETLFGTYPYDRLVIVQGDFPDGMEFSGLVFVGSAWFYGFDGTHKNFLTLISIHEIAHQWWYARVGSDAALNPWQDEALATYSEYLFIEAIYPAEKNWWWTYRVAGYFPQGAVDSAVYQFNTPREYINAVYLRGAQMLQNLREDIGDEAFFKLLRAYYLAGSGSIADPGIFWRQLTNEQQVLTAATRFEFLSEPAVGIPLSEPQTAAESSESGG